IQSFVPEVFEDRSMKTIPAALRNHIHVGAGVAPVRSVVLAGLHFEFLDCIWVGNGNATAEMTAALQVIDLHSVHLIVIVLSRSSMRHHRSFGSSTASSSHFRGVRHIRGNTGIEGNDLRVITCNQRKAIQHLSSRYRALLL